jgi:hypothetical protein
MDKIPNLELLQLGGIHPRNSNTIFKAYQFKSKVQSCEGPARFVLGYIQETKVIGSVEFKCYLKSLLDGGLPSKQNLQQ